MREQAGEHVVFLPSWSTQREKPPTPNSNFLPQLLRTLDSFFHRPLSWLKETHTCGGLALHLAPGSYWHVLDDRCSSHQCLELCPLAHLSSRREEWCPEKGFPKEPLLCATLKRGLGTPPPRALPTPGVKAGRTGFVE